MYTTVELRGLTPFIKSDEAFIEAMVSVPTEPPVIYPVAYQDEDYIQGMKIILQPDGTPWVDGNLYLFSRAKQYPKLSAETLGAEAAHLAEFMNVMLDHSLDHLDFRGREFERPTYRYKAHFKLAVAQSEKGAEGVNNKIRAVIRYYRWRMKYRNFIPAKPMWKEKIIYVSRLDRHGFTRTREVITTDLTFPKNKNESSDFIYDGGKLRPLHKFEQDAVINALLLVNNIEMLLLFILAFFSGMRIQTALTIRVGNVIEATADDTGTYSISAGEGHLVDTKYGKKQNIQVPGWVHHRIFTYLQSDRYQSRKSQALERDVSEQYVFLSKTGKPLYVSHLDKKKYKSQEKGSAVRKFIRDTLTPLLKAEGHHFSFSFHDLRASFGMNLVDERKELLAQGKIGYLELIDYVAKRLHHSNRKTTMSYLDYRRVNEMVHEADTDYQRHIMSLMEN
ncbi:site-specific integrase [Pseudomonas palleroniana]|uniref:site-specific integrase n=1 Tax=Pseudomonas palleroniana TaxID=191390 RepID=UPI0018E6BECE|nr:site-specific integrase [Pseudomonas palleroniana]MBI6909742.1 site-specific integrase [Pseudomonas palleroniana]